MSNVVVVEQKAMVDSKTATIDAAVFNAFVSYLDNKPKTVEAYTKAVKLFMQWIRDQGITAPTRADILNYRAYLQATGHKPTTIQNYIFALRRFFNWAHCEAGYNNIADGVKGAKLDREHKKDALTADQVKRILATIDRSTVKGKRDYAMVMLIVTGGLRTIEVVRANVEDMRTLGDFTALYVQGKGKDEKTDYIKVTAPVEQAINEYLTAAHNIEPGAPLFTSMSNHNTKGRCTTRSISRIVKDAMIQAGINSARLTAHSLRHTAVTLALMANQDIRRVQEFARHANINTTLIYAHDLEKAQNECSSAVTSLIA